MTNDSQVQQALLELDSPELAARIDALLQLRGHQDEQIAPKVIPLLRDPEATIRRLAAEVLSRNLSSSAIVQALIDAIFDENPAVRAAVADALGQLADRAAVPALIDALYDESIDVRFAATEALKLLADPRAVIDLVHVLDNEDAPLAAMAAMALHSIGTPEALAAIQHLREGDTYHFELFPEDVRPVDETQRHIPLPGTESETQTGNADETIRHIAPDALDDYLEGEAAEPTTSTPETPPVTTNPAQFAAYYPREVALNVWNPLRAYVFLPGAADAVAADAAQELGALLPTYREVERTSSIGIAEGALIIAKPELEGFQFNPPSAQVGFYEQWQRFDFKLRAVYAVPDQASNGRITFSVEGVIVADIPLSIYVGGESIPATTTATTTTTRPIYQSIFCSYSHQDTQIVERVERAYKALGMNFLRDVVTLKSGQDWNEELLKLIDSADIFQLFWSSAAATSQSVHMEWEHALGLKRQDAAFIRPVYWQMPMPPPAPELASINFAYEPELGQP